MPNYDGYSRIQNLPFRLRKDFENSNTVSALVRMCPDRFLLVCQQKGVGGVLVQSLGKEREKTTQKQLFILNTLVCSIRTALWETRWKTCSCPHHPTAGEKQLYIIGKEHADFFTKFNKVKGTVSRDWRLLILLRRLYLVVTDYAETQKTFGNNTFQKRKKFRKTVFACLSGTQL